MYRDESLNSSAVPTQFCEFVGHSVRPVLTPLKDVKPSLGASPLTPKFNTEPRTKGDATERNMSARRDVDDDDDDDDDDAEAVVVTRASALQEEYTCMLSAKK
jgi:hypothetical protein